jgi:histidinol dehydrogenase
MMRTFIYPEKKIWGLLCKRPAFEQEELTQTVQTILNKIKKHGDKALIEYSKTYDDVMIHDLKVTGKEFEESILQVSQELKDAIAIAKRNIEKFHKAQFSSEEIIETTKGVKCWRKNVGIEKVGLYIPGGSAPLFSSILMLGIPAAIAGCREIILCTPCDKEKKINPAILYTAQLVGIKKVYKIGGAQAIAAMAYGTETIESVNKIFGPGNQYVTKAKELIQQEGVAIDMPAGPSEVLIIADNTCNPKFVSADLLSQAEHGADSQVVLLTNENAIAKQVKIEIEKQLHELPRKQIASKALQNSFAVIFNSVDDCIAFSNMYAPEHLILSVQHAKKLSDRIINAGSVFLGNYSCESAGDYASGTNHTLPTNGYAKSYSGVSVDSFLKKITFQEISVEGIKNLGPAIEIMAEAEGLTAHKNAVTFRLKTLNND